MAIDEKLAAERLDARKCELEAQSASTRADRAAVTLDQQSVGRLSRMDAMQQQAMSQAQERSRGLELLRIAQAVRRLEDGEYGYCITCGDEVAEKRLAIDPAVSQCVKCAGGGD